MDGTSTSIVADELNASLETCIMEGGKGAASFGIVIDDSTSACWVVVVCRLDRRGVCIGWFRGRCDPAIARRLVVCEELFRTFWGFMLLVYVLMIDDGLDSVFDGIESKMHRTTRPQIRHILKMNRSVRMSPQTQFGRSEFNISYRALPAIFLARAH